MNFLKPFNFRRRLKRGLYDEDAIRISDRNLSFLSEPKFAAAWGAVEAAHHRSGDTLPGVRWRALTCIRAARQALLVEGDFVECGVNLGMMSLAVCTDLDFARLARKFFLFDTFNGIPADGLPEAEQAKAASYRHYRDCYVTAQQNFAAFPNALLVRGKLPGTLDAVAGRKIAYLSMDLNSATYEMQVIERLWGQMSPGAIIVLDDYGFRTGEDQYAAWNDFAKRVGHSIIYSPTGQGLLFKVG